MSIIPASRLSVSDLARLGNNFTPRSQRSPQQRRRREFVVAVNRSLATVGEQVSRLHSAPDYSTAFAAVVA
jgi:hypothetical protein